MPKLLSYTDRDIIRDIEQNVLDQKHKQFAILRRPRNVAIIHLLRMYGRARREISNNPMMDDATFSWYSVVTSSLLKALGHTIKWVINNESSHNIVLHQDNDLQKLDYEANELLIGHGLDYSVLALDYTAWSRGLLTATVDINEKIIKFEINTNFDKKMFINQSSADIHRSEEFYNSLPNKELLDEYKVLTRPFALSLWKEIDNSPAYHSILEWVKKIIFPELPDSTNLGGYTVQDYRQLYAYVFLQSIYSLWTEDDADIIYGIENEVSSLVITAPEDVFLQNFVQATGLTLSIVRAIIRDLTFDVKDFHSSLAHQPFIKNQDGQMFLLARMPATLDPYLMISGALNKSDKRFIYSQIVNILEQGNLYNIETALKKTNLVIHKEQKLLDRNGNKLTPDFLIFDEHNDCLLVMDYKHMLAPIGPSEAISKSKTVESQSVKQVLKYLETFEEDITVVSQLVNGLTHKTKIYALILFRWAMPLPIDQSDRVHTLDWLSFRNILFTNPNIGVPELIEWAIKRPDISIEIEKLNIKERMITIDDWTFVRQIITSSET